MSISRLGRYTTPLIYCGTLLLSVLSFFTTLTGLSIFLDYKLALIGSLGLQLAMLGIAWNMIRIRDNRLSYITVFMAAAMFSIFFSYANFNTSLKSETRATSVRADYYSAIQPLLNQYSELSETTRLKIEYRVGRISDLIKREEQTGWATVVDEGSRDPFIQSVIDGARFMVESWRENQGVDYRQGAGRGIIVEFLENYHRQAKSRLSEINNYVGLLDSLTLSCSGEMPVAKQFAIVNRARVKYPSEIVALLNDANITIPPIPSRSDFIESPSGPDQAFMLIIGDLKRMDGLTIFSILLAVAIDLIVILMALAGSFAMGDEEQLLDRIRREAAQRIRKIPTNDLRVLSEALKENIALYETAGQYGLEIKKTLDNFRDKGQSAKVTLPGKSETEVVRVESKISTSMAEIKAKREKIVI